MTNDTTHESIDGLNVEELRAACRALGLSDKGKKPELIARLQKERADDAAWRALLADPPKYPAGYRFIFDGGIEVPITLDAQPVGRPRDRILFVRATYTLPVAITGQPFDRTETPTGQSEEDAVWTVRRNIGANYPAAEFLRPGQKSRAELAAEIEALRGASLVSGAPAEAAKRAAAAAEAKVKLHAALQSFFLANVFHPGSYRADEFAEGCADEALAVIGDTPSQVRGLFLYVASVEVDLAALASAVKDSSIGDVSRVIHRHITEALTRANYRKHVEWRHVGLVGERPEVTL